VREGREPSTKETWTPRGGDQTGRRKGNPSGNQDVRGWRKPAAEKWNDHLFPPVKKNRGKKSAGVRKKEVQEVQFVID